VTGESEPVARAAGSHLFAGGRQVGGAIEVETVKPVAQSYLATLWDNEAFRKDRDSDLHSLTNRYSRRFTKLVVGIALAAAVFWIFKDATKTLKAFTSVLIVACPCALALAAPLTHGTAQRILARLKIFLKNALVIERMAGVDTIVLDKTGTLTCADARGVEFVSLTPGFNRVFDRCNEPETVSTVLSHVPKTDESVFNSGGGTTTGLKPGVNKKLPAAEADWIGSLARHSTHPNSVRIAKILSFKMLPVSNFKETPGFGIEGEAAGHKIFLGSRAWLEKCGVLVGQASCLSSSDGKTTQQLDRQDVCPTMAGSAVFVAIDGVLRGEFKLENSLRPKVAELLSQLGGNYELALLSGDNEREAARFQKLFGGRAILKFNQSPADKLNFIRELQQRGRKVMMVGDGLNDAGALQQAEVGVAVVEQVGIFSPASDVILDAAELPRLARVLRFSRGAARVVRAGFVISALYNLIGVSIAAAGFLSPVVCAILMPVSSATVVAFTCGTTAWSARRAFGVRWQSEATTPLSMPAQTIKSGVALRFPPQSKLEAA
jgi:Cu+-exporting ATPase